MFEDAVGSHLPRALMRRSALTLTPVGSPLYARASRLRRRSFGRGRDALSWSEALTAASRWHSPDPLCPRRAEIVCALATRAVG